MIKNTGPTRARVATLAGACLLAAASSATAQSTNSSTSVYGRLDLSTDYVSAGTNSNVGYGGAGATVTRMNDNTSRLGFRGREDLGGGNQAQFGIEFGINADNGTTTTPTFRYSFVGLAGGWGTLNLGRLDSSVPTGSPLYSQFAKNLSWIVHDAGVTAIGTRVLNGNNRVSNAIAYKSPNFDGFDVAARLNMAGPDAGAPVTNPNVKTENDWRQYQIALNYASGKLSGGVGYGFDQKNGGFLTNDFKSKVQATGTYNFGFVRPYMGLGQDRYQATATSRSHVNFWLVGATVPLGAGRFTINYMQRDVQTDRAGKLKKLQADYSYFLSKRTRIYVLADQDVTNSNKPNSTAKGVGLGVLHTF